MVDSSPLQIGQERNWFDGLIRGLAARDEVTIQRSLRHAGNGKSSERPAHVSLQIAFL